MKIQKMKRIYLPANWIPDISLKNLTGLHNKSSEKDKRISKPKNEIYFGKEKLGLHGNKDPETSITLNRQNVSGSTSKKAKSGANLFKSDPPAGKSTESNGGFPKVSMPCNFESNDAAISSFCRSNCRL